MATTTFTFKRREIGSPMQKSLVGALWITHLWLCLNRKLPQNFVDTFSKQPAAAAVVSRQINSSQLITAEASQLFREREKWWLSLIVIILWLQLRHSSSTPVTPGLVSLCLLDQRPATLFYLLIKPINSHTAHSHRAACSQSVDTIKPAWKAWGCESCLTSLS